MKWYIILLRGVMPMGKNKVPMAFLREALTKAGFSDVQTYIQSGNVLLRSNLPPAHIEKQIHDIIEKKFGGNIVVVAKTPAQLLKIFKNNPFSSLDTTRTYFVILATQPDKQKVKDLISLNFDPDKFLITQEAVYVYCPGGFGVTKLNNNFFEKKLGISATTRNYNTIAKLIALGGLKNTQH